jgi:hypothetical protein
MELLEKVPVLSASAKTFSATIETVEQKGGQMPAAFAGWLPWFRHGRPTNLLPLDTFQRGLP